MFCTRKKMKKATNKIIIIKNNNSQIHHFRVKCGSMVLVTLWQRMPGFEANSGQLSIGWNALKLMTKDCYFSTQLLLESYSISGTNGAREMWSIGEFERSTSQSGLMNESFNQWKDIEMTRDQTTDIKDKGVREWKMSAIKEWKSDNVNKSRSQGF